MFWFRKPVTSPSSQRPRAILARTSASSLSLPDWDAMPAHPDRPASTTINTIKRIEYLQIVIAAVPASGSSPDYLPDPAGPAPRPGPDRRRPWPAVERQSSSAVLGASARPRAVPAVPPDPAGAAAASHRPDPTRPSGVRRAWPGAGHPPPPARPAGPGHRIRAPDS